MKIDMKPMEKDLPFALMFTTSLNEVPHVHGYASEEDRDTVYENYIVTGEMTIRDDNLGGIMKTVEPVYVARLNLVDGAVNFAKVIESFGGEA